MLYGIWLDCLQVPELAAGGSYDKDTFVFSGTRNNWARILENHIPYIHTVT